MKFVIVTGMSGAGKSTAVKMLEDMGFFCVDNLPVQFISKFYELACNSMDEVTKIAVVVDIRSGSGLGKLDEILDNINKDGNNCQVLFMDSGDDTLVKRYKETRRSHPLNVEGRVDEGIKLERKELDFLRKRADYIVNTDSMLTRDLRQELEKIFVEDKNYSNMFINVVSFGFKYGIPNDADLVFDVRFMPNPYYVDELKQKTGLEEDVNEYVMNSEASVQFLDKLLDMIKFLIPNYIKEGKTQLVICIGCTGGKHRSVTVAKKLYEALKAEESYGVKLTNRDIKR